MTTARGVCAYKPRAGHEFVDGVAGMDRLHGAAQGELGDMVALRQRRDLLDAPTPRHLHRPMER